MLKPYSEVEKLERFRKNHSNFQVIETRNASTAVDALLIGVLQDCSNASKIWEPLRPKQPKIPWSKVIRKGPTVPMHSFIARFTLQNHFPTEGWFIGLGSASKIRMSLM
ncbi:hypothetical protein V6N11_053904 [Hibiscus sabdariffa]|uniref:Uncharacterized protein n=1 Tax=Hibiscus sabdariffa TaxID=183260 RepID=A0ABR2S282_9ROSI